MALGAWYLPFLHDHQYAHLGPTWLTGTAAWDSVYYLDIAHTGYYAKALAFFPLYPLLIHGMTYMGMSLHVGAFLVNLLATLGASWFLYSLLEQRFGEKTAFRSLWLFLVFPAALFLSAIYTESLFCFLVFGGFYFSQRKRPWLVGLFCALASGTRSYGILLGLILAFDYFIQKKWKEGIIIAVMAPIGLLGYMWYLDVNFSDPLAFIHTYKIYWDNHVFSLNIFKTYWMWIKQPYEFFRDSNIPQFFRYFSELVSWTAAVVLTIIGSKKNHWTWTAFSFLCLGFFILTTTQQSVNRYVLPLFTMYPVLATLPDEWYTGWLVVSASAMGVMALLFAACYWVG